LALSQPHKSLLLALIIIPRSGPFFHLYPPWSCFVWSYFWRQTNPVLFGQAFGMGVMAALGSFAFLALALMRRFRVNPFLHGSARWAGESDIKAAGLLDNNGVYVGAWRDKRGRVHYLRHNGPEHVAARSAPVCPPETILGIRDGITSTMTSIPRSV
jgi:type IV secretory pathway TraG/TraD family ATPase VirD4